MAIVYVKNKGNGVTYVYESKGHWDKEKQQARSSRVCIGKLDSETGEFIPSKRLGAQSPRQRKTSLLPPSEPKRLLYGAVYLLDSISKTLGIKTDLKKCFPDSYKKILSIVYYLILENGQSLSRFPKWANLHLHPYGKDIPSPKMVELFSAIPAEETERFFRLQGKRRGEEDYRFYDASGIFSYSEALKQVKTGISEIPTQVNLGFIIGEKSKLPVYYRKLSGNPADVRILKILFSEIGLINHKRVTLVLSRGMISEEHLNELAQNHWKILTRVKPSLKLVEKEINLNRVVMLSETCFNSEYNMYIHSSYINRQNSLNPISAGSFLHLYYSQEPQRDETMKLANNLLNSGYPLKYFNSAQPIKQKPKNQEVIDEGMKNLGFFALFSNTVKNPLEALKIYQLKDLLEKPFENLKDRFQIGSNLDGILFIEFIVLIYLSYLQKLMDDNQLNQAYTIQSLLDELDGIECFKEKGKELRLGDMNKKQLQLYEFLGIKQPVL